MTVRVRPSRAVILPAIATATAACVVGLAAPSAYAAADTAAAPTGNTGGKAESVIVVLKDQLSATPATDGHLSERHSLAHSAQAAVLGRLAGASPSQVVNYTVGNAFSATVTSGQAALLAADPAVASVVPNRKVEVDPGTAAQQSQARPQATPASGGATVDPRACSTDPTKPVLEPEALQTMNVRSSDPKAKTAAALGIDGSGVKVAYIADGINPNNKGFIRSNGKSSITDYKDFYGDGPNAQTSGAEAFGDASAVSAQGNVVYDVADYSNPSSVNYPGGHCYIKIVGVAPGANVVALKAGSELLPNSAILQSIDYAVSVAHVDVINESFGANITPNNDSLNTIQLFNDQAVRAGITVTASSGDAGITSTIGSPATDPLVISTGASTDNRLYEQTNYALATRFGNGTWQDSNVSALSSAGITQDGRTIDVSAPGEADWAVCDSGGNFVGCTSFGNPRHPYADIQAFGGTSQSAPFTAGVAALVIQAYRKTHGGESPTPAVTKKIITSTASDLNLPGDEQGSGLVNARAAVEAALTWPGATKAAPASTGSNVALSTNQLTLSGKPGSSQTGAVKVTNVGTKPLSVATATRRYATVGVDKQQLTLDTTSSQTTPYPVDGKPWVYKTTTFTVPPGVDELRSFIRWKSGAAYGGPGPVVRMSLFAPSGQFASNTRPQGGANPANYGLATVKNPVAGKWTAVLYTPVNGGFSGQVTFGADNERAIPAGTVTPANTTLAPGRSTSVAVKVSVPALGGDTVDTVSVASSDGHRVAVPVIVRSLVSQGGSFGGVITGGNARASAPAQKFSYDLNVPAGKRDIQVGVTLAHSAKYLLRTILIDPSGSVQSVNSNQTMTASGKTVQGRSAQNTAADPTKGTWRFVVVVVSPVPGGRDSEPFTGTLKFNQVQVSALKVPASIKADKPVSRELTVTNNGDAPLVVQTDARTGRPISQQLAPQFAGNTIRLPQDVEDLSQLPAYLVPPDTTSLSLTASSTVPAQVELSSPRGGVDVFGDLAKAQGGSTVSTASLTRKTGQVGLGFWSPYVQEIGPFGDAGAPSGTSTLTATALTPALDSSVRTSTGDPFAVTFDPTVKPGRPVVIAPGASKKITVTITPAGKKGSTVKGVLHLVTTPIGVAGQFNTTGEELTSLPYSYTIG